MYFTFLPKTVAKIISMSFQKRPLGASGTEPPALSGTRVSALGTPSGLLERALAPCPLAPLGAPNPYDAIAAKRDTTRNARWHSDISYSYKL